MDLKEEAVELRNIKLLEDYNSVGMVEDGWIFIEKKGEHYLLLNNPIYTKIKIEQKELVEIQKVGEFKNAFYYEREIYVFNSIVNLDKETGIFFSKYGIIYSNGQVYNAKIPQ